MRILLYTANFAPEPTGIGKYSGEMAAWLVAQGHDVRVVSAPPYYPAWKVSEGYGWPLYRREKWQGVDVWRAPIWVPSKPAGLTRVLHLLSFVLSSLPVMLWQTLWRPQVVMTVAPALMCAPTGWLVAKLSGGKSWLHIQDFEVDVAFQMKLLNGIHLSKVVLKAERKLMQLFDVVSTISSRMVDKLHAKGVSAKQVKFFPNWVDINHILPLRTPSTYRESLGIDVSKKVVLFSGTLGDKQGLMVISETAKLLAKRQDVVFVICGNGLIKPKLQHACKGLKNVRFLPLQPFEQLNELLGLADIHLLPQSPDATDLVLPSKLSGMLASGKPVIATCLHGTELASVVSQCGLIVPPENAVKLAVAIQHLAEDAELRLQMGIRARLFAERNLACDSVLERLQEDIKALCTEPPRVGQPIQLEPLKN